MSREKPLRRLGADPFLFRHSAQLVERALSLREWSCSGLRSCFVSVCRAQEHFLRCGFISSLGRRHSSSETSSLTVIHSISGNAWSYRRLVAYGFLGLSEGA